MKNSDKSFIKNLCEYLPLIIFFGVYKLSHNPMPIIPATLSMIIVTFITLLISYILYKEIPLMPLVSAIILGIFGGLTVLLKDDIFIKLKPTIINSLFAAILLYGYIIKKPFLYYILGSQIKVSHNAWLKLSLRWAAYFLFLAFLNEIIWRSFSTDFWVQFKVFGMLPLTLIFTMSQIPFIMREMKEFEKSQY